MKKISLEIENQYQFFLVKKIHLNRLPELFA